MARQVHADLFASSREHLPEATVNSSSLDNRYRQLHVFGYETEWSPPDAEAQQCDATSTWQELLLNSWFSHRLRMLDRQELLAFETLLQTPQAKIGEFIERKLAKGKFVARDHNQDTLSRNGLHQFSPSCSSVPGIGASSSSGATVVRPPLELSEASLNEHDDLNTSFGPSNIFSNGNAWSPLPFFDLASMRLPLESAVESAEGLVALQTSDLGFQSDEQLSKSSLLIGHQLPIGDTPKIHHAKSPSATKALQRLARFMIHNKASAGCTLSNHRRAETGEYACTLGCDYRTTRLADLKRHEERVYPQEFYFCPVCGDSENPSKALLITRKDKILGHIKHFHSGTVTLQQCRVKGIRGIFPKDCPLCLHHRHSSWEQRDEHNKQHYRSGHVFPKVADRKNGLENISPSHVKDDVSESSHHDSNDEGNSIHQQPANENINHTASGGGSSGCDTYENHFEGYDPADWIQPHHLRAGHHTDPSMRNNEPFAFRRSLRDFGAITTYLSWVRQRRYLAYEGIRLPSSAEVGLSSHSTVSVSEHVELASTIHPRLLLDVHDFSYTGAQFDDMDGGQSIFKMHPTVLPLRTRH
ncbi:hypothetical protein HBI56_196690 [Parastagonospora nodorum]|nr:hypothetical protein HBH74_164010 [Parastagonospora nodorum]KAH4926853.1 hypothetical protein HBH73_203530 [Parastagonospora nodorum]KAH5091946.1 hypothetical protein HBH72_196190 [Parastagonospora nodorum]KAH5325082.1 hypothetical protein HBI11_023170 [Parastagonospora nodorum]KAH5402582.1 hypothetical protein HBI47_189850 [Parastagonospora nodorum]